MKLRIWFVLFVLGASVGVVLLGRHSKPPAALTSATVAAAPAPMPAPVYRGVAGCAGRACHGGPQTGDALFVRKAASHWLAFDKHADAYAVLCTPRSQQMIAKLTDEPNPIPAHRDARCLACHTIPQTVYAAGDAQAVALDEATLALRRDGVGCEACHGSSRGWIDAHQTNAWAIDRRANYKRQGMTWLSDYLTRAAVCTGCHVGAAANSTEHLPLRDVNHDLIAAGHPRLSFELVSYQEALPPHWAEPPSEEMRLWLAGQRRTAEAALDLLQDRATRGPWPEFAESDCFACHHDLAAKSWRQETPDYSKRRAPGSVPWNYWSVSRPFEALLRQSADGDGVKVIEDLRIAMSQPKPDVQEVRAKAKGGQSLLRTKYNTLAAFGDDLHGKLTLASALPDDADAMGLGNLGWDDAVQYYLLLAVLRQTKPAGDERMAIDTKLSELGQQLSLPRDRETSNSPQTFRREDVTGQGLRHELDELRRLLKP
jgi:Cytochrome c554 and c-prime